MPNLKNAQFDIAKLDVSGLQVSRTGKLVISDLSFSAQQSAILHIKGENGVGKSSLLRTLAGFIRPEAGSIECIDLNGEKRDIADVRADQVHYMGHKLAIKPHFTLAEDLKFHRDLSGGAHAGDIEEVLADVGLDGLGDMACGFLSAGQQKRLCVARLLLVPKPIWLLDEPFAALDMKGQALVSDVVAQHCAKGGLVLLVNHQPLRQDIAHHTLELKPVLSHQSDMLDSDEMFL